MERINTVPYRLGSSGGEVTVRENVLPSIAIGHDTATAAPSSNNSGVSGGGWLNRRVYGAFYRYGLLAASRPHWLAASVLALAIYLSVPVVSVHSPLSFMQAFYVPATNSRRHMSSDASASGSSTDGVDVNGAPQSSPAWLHLSPDAYVLQVRVRSAVIPWQSDLATDEDWLRTPLSRAFLLAETITNFSYRNLSILDHCFMVEEPVSTLSERYAPLLSLLPRYNCLLLSPARLWRNNAATFAADTDITNTVLKAQRAIVPLSYGSTGDNAGGVSLINIMFGSPTQTRRGRGNNGAVRWLTRVNRHPHVIVSYALTLVLRKYDRKLIDALRAHLVRLYPDQRRSNSLVPLHTVHVLSPALRSPWQPLYVLSLGSVLAIYMHFSLRKMPSLVGKRRLSVYTLVTVLATVASTCGLLVSWGLSEPLAAVGGGGAVFRYLLSVLAFENALVIVSQLPSAASGGGAGAATDAVFTEHLQPRVRVARAVAAQGWPVVKGLVKQAALLLAGVASGVPVVVEFCVPAAAALFCDRLLQLGFFLPLVCADLCRRRPLGAPPSQLSPRVHLVDGIHDRPVISVVTRPYEPDSLIGCLPRRIRLFFLWARVRLVHRSVSTMLVLAMLAVAYNTGVLQRIVGLDWHAISTAVNSTRPVNVGNITPSTSPSPPLSSPAAGSLGGGVLTARQTLSHVVDTEHAILSPHYWSQLLRLYNSSADTEPLRITVLPAVLLSAAVQPQEARAWRSQLVPPSTRTTGGRTDGGARGGSRLPFFLPFLRLGSPEGAGGGFTGRIHFTDVTYSGGADGGNNDARVTGASAGGRAGTDPASVVTEEWTLVVILTLPSLVLLVYVTVLLYRCMCSRNYAQWRSSWQQERSPSTAATTTTTTTADAAGFSCSRVHQMALHSSPQCLRGHRQQVECVSSDEQLHLVASSCLAGQLRVWNVSSGSCVRVIDRCHDNSTTADGSDVVMATHNDCQSLVTAAASISSSCQAQYATVRHRHHKISPTSTPCQNGHVDLTTQMMVAMETGAFHQRTQPVAMATAVTSLKTDRVISCSRADDATVAAKSCLNNGGYNFGSLRTRDQPAYESSRNQPAYQPAPVSSAPTCTTQVVWCLDFADLLLAVGCGRGAVELWDAVDGSRKLIYTACSCPVTHIALWNDFVCSARLDGSLVLHRMMPDQSAGKLTWQQFSDARRSCGYEALVCGGAADGGGVAVVACSLRWRQHLTVPAHQAPVTVLRCGGGDDTQRYKPLLLSASVDHTVKVYYRDESRGGGDGVCVCYHSLQLHTAPITACHILPPDFPSSSSHSSLSCVSAATGAADGFMCVWQLATGVCMYRVRGHEGSVTCIAANLSYIVSVGGGETGGSRGGGAGECCLCVWDRQDGHAICCLPLSHNYSAQCLLLSASLCVTARQGSLVIWDLEQQCAVRQVRLGSHDSSVFVHQMALVGGCVVCDYGHDLRAVHMPLAEGFSKKLH